MPTSEPTEVTTHRLTPEAYAALEKQLANANVDNDTSVLNAGFKLGVQAALSALRKGFVVG